jgi:hypothetical protein
MKNEETLFAAAVIGEGDLAGNVELETAIVAIVREAAVHAQAPCDDEENSRPGFYVPLSSVPVPAHEPKPPYGEEQHRQKRDGRDDFITIEIHPLLLVLLLRRRRCPGWDRLRQQLVDRGYDRPIAVQSARLANAHQRRFALVYADNGILLHNHAIAGFDLTLFKFRTRLAIAASTIFHGGAKIGFVLAREQRRFSHRRLRVQRNRDRQRAGKHNGSSHDRLSLPFGQNRPF